MRDPIDFLASEIPGPHGHGRVKIRVAHSKWQDLDPVRRWTARDERGADERGDERRLADIALTDQQDLGVILRNGITKASQVNSNGI